MDRETEIQKIEEQNDFLRSMLRSLDDIKEGRIHPFKFSDEK